MADNTSKIPKVTEEILRRMSAQGENLEERLKESEARYNNLLDNLKDEYLFYRHDTNGRFNLPSMAYRIIKDAEGWRVDFVSEGCRQIFGLDPTALINHKPAELKRLIHPDDLKHLLEIIENVSNGAKQLQCEYRILTTSDQTKWVFDKAEVIHDRVTHITSIEGFMADFTVYKKMEQKLKDENLLLRSTIRDRHKFIDIIGNCPAMQEVFDLIVKAATSEDNVFIFGESGTGKELVAQAIHKSSHRKDRSFVAVNCAAIPENLIKNTDPANPRSSPLEQVQSSQAIGNFPQNPVQKNEIQRVTIGPVGGS